MIVTLNFIYHTFAIRDYASMAHTHTHDFTYYAYTLTRRLISLRSLSLFPFINAFNNKSLQDKTIEFIFTCKQYFHRSESLINDRIDTQHTMNCASICIDKNNNEHKVCIK